MRWGDKYQGPSIKAQTNSKHQNVKSQKGPARVWNFSHLNLELVRALELVIWYLGHSLWYLRSSFFAQNRIFSRWTRRTIRCAEEGFCHELSPTPASPSPMWVHPHRGIGGY